jgi:hypothetical protein
MFNPGKVFSSVCLGLGLVWFFPSVSQIMRRYKPTWEDMAGKAMPAPIPTGRIALWLNWQPTPIRAVIVGLVFCSCLMSLTKVSEFLYFQF